MDCPNCGKKPVGILSMFSSRGVGFKKSMNGLFRCRHCETLLIQEKNDLGIGKFKKPFWILYSLLFIVILATVWLSFYFLDSSIGSVSFWYTFPFILIACFLYLLLIEKMKYKYWIIRETTFEEHEEEISSQKLSGKEIITFIFFSVAAIASFLYLNEIMKGLNLNPSVYTISAILYMLLIIGMAFMLMKYFNKSSSNENA